MRHNLVLLAALVAAACGPTNTDISANGTGSVAGAAAGLEFSFGAERAIAVFEDAAAAPAVDVNIRLCERECEPLGIELQPASRALLISIRVDPAALTSGAVLPVGTTLQALAAVRTGVLNGASASGRNVSSVDTLVERADSGEVRIESADVRPGGRIAGSFQLQLHSGGSVIGSFSTPLLLAR